jgi:hypothetical protein
LPEISERHERRVKEQYKIRLEARRLLSDKDISWRAEMAAQSRAWLEKNDGRVFNVINRRLQKLHKSVLRHCEELDREEQRNAAKAPPLTPAQKAIADKLLAEWTGDTRTTRAEAQERRNELASTGLNLRPNQPTATDRFIEASLQPVTRSRWHALPDPPVKSEIPKPDPYARRLDRAAQRAEENRHGRELARRYEDDRPASYRGGRVSLAQMTRSHR